MNTKETLFASLLNTEIIKPANSTPTADAQFFPMYFSLGQYSEKFLLPYEPMISISGKNNIIKRRVAKPDNAIKGTIKERWAQDDYEIKITGLLIGEHETGNVRQCFPISDFTKLKDFMTIQPMIWVFCEPLQLLGIHRIVIEDFNFPFTKGENVQAYEIKAVSDSDFTLLKPLTEII
jgi:hypothetical protein